MADLGFDGMIRVDFVPTIASKATPTVAELTAGVPLTPRLVPDGLSRPAETADVKNSKMNSTFNTATVGRRSFNLSVRYMRGPSSDSEAAAVEAALIWKATGYLVVRTDIVNTTAYAAAQKVEVYPVQVKTPSPADVAENANQTVEVGFTLTGDPKPFSEPATVAA